VNKNQMSLLGITEVKVDAEVEKGMLLTVDSDAKIKPLDNDTHLTHN
jgi:hypothetical protein